MIVNDTLDRIINDNQLFSGWDPQERTFGVPKYSLNGEPEPFGATNRVSQPSTRPNQVSQLENSPRWINNPKRLFFFFYDTIWVLDDHYDWGVPLPAMSVGFQRSICVSFSPVQKILHWLVVTGT